MKKGNGLTPGSLSLLLAQKGLGIAALATSRKYDCAVAVLFLGTSLTKAAVFTVFTGPAHFAITAAELLSECYGTDKSCGISSSVRREVERVALPAAMWLESGVIQWLSSGR